MKTDLSFVIHEFHLSKIECIMFCFYVMKKGPKIRILFFKLSPTFAS